GVLVVGRGQLRAADVGLDDGRVVTADLDEQHLEAGALATRPHRGATGPSGVGGVVDRDLAVAREPPHHVLEGVHRGPPARLFARRVVGIEETVPDLGPGWLGGLKNSVRPGGPAAPPPVLADVEAPGAVAEPREIALDATGGIA